MKGIQRPQSYSPTATGAFQGLTFDQYLADPGSNKSRLMLLDERFGGCPAKAKLGAEDKETRALKLGTCMHAYALEGEKPWVLSAFPNFRTNEAKEWRDAQTLPILTEQEEAEVTTTAHALRRHPHAWPLIKGGRREVSMFADYEGHRIKCRPDILQPTHMVDIKTARDASTHAFSGAIARFGYDLQAAICWKTAVLLGFGDLPYYLIAIEQWPSAAGTVPLFNVRKLSSGSLQAALARLEANLVRLKECRETGDWPDYTGPEVGEIDAPAWTMPDEAEIDLAM